MKKILLFLITIFSIAALAVGCDLIGSGSKTPLTADMISGEALEREYVYTGKAVIFDSDGIIITYNGGQENNDLFDFSFSDNNGVGTGKLKITAKSSHPYLKGSVTVTFGIISADGNISDYDDLTDAIEGGLYTELSISDDVVVEEGHTLTVPSNVTLIVTDGSALTIDGNLVIEGTLRVGKDSDSNRSFLYVNGSASVRGVMEITAGGTLFNAGTIDIVGTLSSDGYVYTNSAIVGAPSDTVMRTSLSDVEVELSYYETTFLQYQVCTPEVFISGTQISDYSNVEYINNDRAGEAFAIVRAPLDDELYYGERRLSFTIKKGSAQIPGNDTFNELKDYQNSGNYSEYRCMYLDVPQNETLTIAEDETLSVYDLSIYGTLVNYGTVLIASTGGGSNAALSVISYLDNRGTIEVASGATIYSGTLKNSGTLSIGSSLIVPSEYDVTIENSLGGYIETGALRLSGSASFVNRGEISIDGNAYDVYLAGAVSNYGQFSLKEASSAWMDGTVFNNYSGATFTLDADTVFNAVEFHNQGTFVNKNDIVFNNAPTAFSNTDGLFDNTDGRVFSAYSLQGIEVNLIEQKLLGSEGAEVVLEYTSVVYDGKKKSPSFTIGGKSVSDAMMRPSYKYKDESDYSVNTKTDAGDVDVLFYADPSYKLDYCGEYVATFSIARASIEAGPKSLKTILTSRDTALNYERVSLAKNTSLSSSDASSYTVPEWLTLDLNGCALTLDGADLYNYGTVCDSSLGYADLDEYLSKNDVTECGLTLLDSTLFNYGSVSTEKVVYIRQDSSVSLEDGSTWHNGGAIFTHASCPLSDIDGTIFVRSTLSDNMLLIEDDSIAYDGEEKTPSVSISSDYADKISSDDLFIKGYVDNVTAGNAFAYVTVNNPFHKAICDSYSNGSSTPVSIVFRIKRAVKYLSTSDGEEAFLAAIADSNYCRVVLTQPLTIKSSGYKNMADDMIIDVGDGYLSFSSSSGLNISSGSTIWARPTTADKLISVFPYASVIVLGADIGAVDLKYIDTSQYQTASSYEVYHYRGVDVINRTIDLDGHVIDGQFKFENVDLYINLTLTDSAQTKGHIGNPDSSDDGFYSVSHAAYSLRLDGITIHGIHVGDEVTLTVNDSSVTD